MNNPVAKFSYKFNKAGVIKTKKTYVRKDKHKKKDY